MNFELLRRSHLKRNIMIGIIVVAIISAIILNFTKAKYRVTQSIPLVNGTINYKPYDFKMIAMYQKDGSGEYVEIEEMPNSGYIINEEKSYCTVDGINKDESARLYTTGDGDHAIANLQKGSKCYLYFDVEEGITFSEILLTKDIQTRSDFGTTLIADTTGIIYQTTDWSGTSYYFAGNPTDNWVHFGGFYWRIVRVNGDGTVRLIYNGTSTTTTGVDTVFNNYQVFNTLRDRSEYVGFKYTLNEQHGQSDDSVILDSLLSWYSSSGLSATQYSDHIDIDIGYCDERNVASGYTWSSEPSSTLRYAAYERLVTNKTPSLNCNSNDVIKEPVGLITADEVAFAGGVYNIDNSGYYLYNNQSFWTMTPFGVDSDGYPVMFRMYSDGDFSAHRAAYMSSVRPVINLKADTKFEGSGTSSDPYTVVG